MAKERLINTRFWNDSWVRKLNALDRYLFIYLLTNEYTNISGIYELPIETIAYGSGLDERDLEKTMFPRLEPKVFYKNGWVIITNFPKYQRLKSDKVLIGVIKSLNEAPKDIVLYAKNKGYGYDIDMIWKSYHILESESESESELEYISEETSQGKEINSKIELFKPLNPLTYKKWYKNKTQRGAIGRLIQTLGDKLELAIKAAEKANETKYAPTITTPLQLEDKLSALRAWMAKEQSTQKWHILL